MRYKLLEDFSCYDADGVTNTPQGAVQMVFPSETDAFGSMKDLIKAGLIEDDMLQARQDKAVPDIVKQVQAVLPAFEQSVKEGKVKKKSAAKATQTVQQELRPAAYSREDVFDKNASDAERYRYLRDQTITATVYKPGTVDKYVTKLQGDTLEEKYEILQKQKMRDIKRAMADIANAFNLPKDYFANAVLEFDFRYSNRAVDESVQY